MSEDVQKLGKYTLLEKIAQGGMAQVFKAKTLDPNGFERLVVIKRILPHISADPEYVEMLVDEAKIAVNFTHGNIAQIYDLGRVKNDYFIVMEYVDGKTFSQIVKKLKKRQTYIPLDILLYCAIETCHGLSYIHNKKGIDGKNMGVVHRDISPQNIILSYAGQIKIIDFGVAKARSKEGKTESGVLKGKFAYMSPEQSRSDTIDSRSDIFSLGTLLWESSTGQRLFKKKTNQETVRAIQKAKYVTASAFRPDIPKDFEKILKKALQKNPKNRYQDATDMAYDLEKLLFNINPDFKPVYAAEFVYKLFGPEEDEKNLPDHIFVKEKTPVTKLNVPQEKINQGGVLPEEPTIKESFDNELTPVTRIKQKKSNSRLLWLMAFFIFIFISGSIYVYLVNRAEKATLILSGLNNDMIVYVNKNEIDVLDNSPITLASNQQYYLRVTQIGYDDYTHKFYLKPFEKKTLEIKLQSKEPESVVLSIETTPPGATVYINSIEWQQKTPVVIKNLELNTTYKLGLFLEKYKFYTEDIVFEKANPLVLQHVFLKNAAHLSIKTNPIGATILIDDHIVGISPFQDSNAKPNEKIRIIVRHEGYKEQNKTVTLTYGEEMTVNFELEKE